MMMVLFQIGKVGILPSHQLLFQIKILSFPLPDKYDALWISRPSFSGKNKFLVQIVLKPIANLMSEFLFWNFISIFFHTFYFAWNCLNICFIFNIFGFVNTLRDLTLAFAWCGKFSWNFSYHRGFSPAEKNRAGSRGRNWSLLLADAPCYNVLVMWPQFYLRAHRFSWGTKNAKIQSNISIFPV